MSESFLRGKFQVGDAAIGTHVGHRVSGNFGKGVIRHIHGKRATVEYGGCSQKLQIKLCHLQLENSESSVRSIQEEKDKACDRAQPNHFGELQRRVDNDGQVSIFWDDTAEPPLPEEFASIQEFEKAWEKWEQLHNLTFVPEWEQDSHLQDSNSENLSSLDSVIMTNIVDKSSSLDSLMSKSQTTSGTYAGTISQSSPLLSVNGEEESSILLLPVPLVNPSQSKEIEKEVQTGEIASQQSSELLMSSDQSFSALKTSLDYLPVPTSQEESCCIFSGCLKDFPTSGMMRNGYVFPADILPLPSLGNDYFWLESPGALSSHGKGRPPGLNRLETFLKKKGLLKSGEVLNPDILSDWFNIPKSWLNPLELKAATELLENSELLQETFSTQESQRSHSDESFTLTDSDYKLLPEKFLEEKEESAPGLPEQFLEEGSNTQISSKKKPSGCLYRYLEHKKLKSGAIASYPRVEGTRNPDNPKHWRWGFNWEEKLDGEWKGRSIGSIPVHIVPAIEVMQHQGATVREIITFIKSEKFKKRSK